MRFILPAVLLVLLSTSAGAQTSASDFDRAGMFPPGYQDTLRSLCQRVGKAFIVHTCENEAKYAYSIRIEAMGESYLKITRRTSIEGATAVQDSLDFTEQVITLNLMEIDPNRLLITKANYTWCMPSMRPRLSVYAMGSKHQFLMEEKKAVYGVKVVPDPKFVKQFDLWFPDDRMAADFVRRIRTAIKMTTTVRASQ